MARPLKGSVITHKGKDGRTYRSCRFTANGKRRRKPLGPNVSEQEASAILAQIIRDVRDGTYADDPLEADEKRALRHARRAKLAANRQHQAEALSLTRKAAQAADGAARAAEVQGGSKRLLSLAWHHLDEAAQAIDRAIRGAG